MHSHMSSSYRYSGSLVFSCSCRCGCMRACVRACMRVSMSEPLLQLNWTALCLNMCFAGIQHVWIMITLWQQLLWTIRLYVTLMVVG